MGSNSSIEAHVLSTTKVQIGYDATNQLPVFILLRDIVFRVESQAYPKCRDFVVPSGFVSDGASCPGISTIRAVDMMTPGIIHDWLYSTECLNCPNREYADGVLWSLVRNRLGSWTAWRVHTGVRIFGAKSYNAPARTHWRAKIAQENYHESKESNNV